jgi:hypothetical protein
LLLKLLGADLTGMYRVMLGQIGDRCVLVHGLKVIFAFTPLRSSVSDRSARRQIEN